ncbi:MAG: hypothetical protein M3Y56_16715, partial [Armatimonadota bacterium]|nr:hypothetical protein [Armatimonadota bacterium]
MLDLRSSKSASSTGIAVTVILIYSGILTSGCRRSNDSRSSKSPLNTSQILPPVDPLVPTTASNANFVDVAAKAHLNFSWSHPN